MPRIMKILGILGFLVCLGFMYMTDLGICGIRKAVPAFRVLDMRFHYNSETVGQVLDQLGENGRLAYQRYLVLDFAFILFFFLTMLAISDSAMISMNIKPILYILCGLRALFDILENIMLIHMLRQYPSFNSTLAGICGWITTMKFLMLFIWLIGILSQAVMAKLKA